VCTTESYILVIVSMVDGHLFEKICEIAARLRKKTDRPFGGIQVGTSDHSCQYINDDSDAVQLVVTGDFFQLPPVTKTGNQPFFAFECDAWKTCIDHTVTLTQVFRQKDDSTYSRPTLDRRTKE
jgi:ATP-dependent DNA helicase PIF1